MSSKGHLQGSVQPHEFHLRIFRKAGLIADQSSGDDNSDAGTTTTARDKTDTAWTWPTDDETQGSLNQVYRDDSLNGYKPLHLAVTNAVIEDVGYPDTDENGNPILVRLPSMQEIVKAVWNLLPTAIQTSIKKWAENDSDTNENQIAAAILSYVKEVLISKFKIPALVVRIILGVILPKIVVWIVQNIGSL